MSINDTKSKTSRAHVRLVKDSDDNALGTGFLKLPRPFLEDLKKAAIKPENWPKILTGYYIWINTGQNLYLVKISGDEAEKLKLTLKSAKIEEAKFDDAIQKKTDEFSTMLKSEKDKLSLEREHLRRDVGEQVMSILHPLKR